MKKMPVSTVATLTLCMLFFVVVTALAVPAPVRSYVWYGELVALNEQARTAVLKAQFREHVLRYIDQFKPGDRVMLNWATSREGETDDLIYVGQYDKGSGSNYGYVLPVELVAVNTSDRTITFQVPVPARVLQGLKTIQIGSRVKVTAPFDQPTETAAIGSIEPSDGQHTTASTATRN